MTRRWVIWTAGLLLLALIALFPLRVALATSDLAQIGFTARQVAGTIWYGRIGNLQLRSHPLGTFEVRLEPAPLLLGNVSMQINRMDDPDGVFTGRLVAGLKRGIKQVDGRLAVGTMFAPLPVEALELRNATVLFRNGLCVEAAGTVTPVLATPAPGFDFGADVSGAIECDGERARVVMRNPSGSERVEFYVDARGSYRGWMSINGLPPEAGAALAPLGFRSGPGGLTLTTRGRL